MGMSEDIAVNVLKCLRRKKKKCASVMRKLQHLCAGRRKEKKKLRRRHLQEWRDDAFSQLTVASLSARVFTLTVFSPDTERVPPA